MWKRMRWISVGISLVLLGYVLSYGPVTWLRWWRVHPWIESALGYLYWPLDMLVAHGPTEIANALLWYAAFWLPDGFSSAT